jgi:hypothetical protein
VNAADHLREAIEFGCTRDDHDHIADHRAEVRQERDAEIVAWLIKKAREYRSTGSKQHALQADVIEVMASKIQRGAVRPPQQSAAGGAPCECGQPTRPGCGHCTHCDTCQDCHQCAGDGCTCGCDGGETP